MVRRKSRSIRQERIEAPGALQDLLSDFGSLGRLNDDKQGRIATCRSSFAQSGQRTRVSVAQLEQQIILAQHVVDVGSGGGSDGSCGERTFFSTRLLSAVRGGF